MFMTMDPKRSAQLSPGSVSDFSLWYLVACVASTVSPNKQHRGIWQGRHSSGSLEGGEEGFYMWRFFEGALYKGGGVS